MNRERRIRGATEADLDRIVEIEACAYPDDRSHDTIVRELTRHPMGGLDRFRLLEESGEIVGQGFLFETAIWLGGALVPAGAIASLAVAPEARRHGAGSFLLHAMHAELREQRAPLSLLYPFSGAFYARRGYARTSPLVWLRASPGALGALPEPLDAAGSVRPDARSVRMSAGENRAREIRALYDRTAIAHAGRLTRTDRQWEHRFAKDRRHWMVAESTAQGVVGYLEFAYDAPALHGPSSLLVHEMVADEPATRLALLKALATQSNQIDTIELCVGTDDPLLFALADGGGPRRGAPGIEHPLGVCGMGPMLHVVDTSAALEARGYPVEGRLTLTVMPDHPESPATETLEMEVRGGRASVKRREAAGSAAHHLYVHRRALASIIAAGMSPTKAERLGQIRAANPDALRIAEDLFAGPRFLCRDLF